MLRAVIRVSVTARKTHDYIVPLVAHFITTQVKRARYLELQQMTTTERRGPSGLAKPVKTKKTKQKQSKDTSLPFVVDTKPTPVDLAAVPVRGAASPRPPAGSAARPAKSPASAEGHIDNTKNLARKGRRRQEAIERERKKIRERLVRQGWDEGEKGSLEKEVDARGAHWTQQYDSKMDQRKARKAQRDQRKAQKAQKEKAQRRAKEFPDAQPAKRVSTTLYDADSFEREMKGI
ncbi:hypothetical protein GGR56DRAFT_116819 [Xylariaceae sp. FL0804]|nr:hypothetical protein GGR56DRAFT_116819 [Xylariaceae sp. FL0804]